MSRRLSNWPRLLADYIESRRAAPFAWGENDCCLFSGNGIRAITGLDPAAKAFRGRYCGAPGAMRLLKKHGGVEAIAAAQALEFGFPELRTPLLAQRGDVVLCDLATAGLAGPNAKGPSSALGLCVGATAAFVRLEGGLAFIPLNLCRRAWRII